MDAWTTVDESFAASEKAILERATAADGGKE
jgi:hypothetical protein